MPAYLYHQRSKLSCLINRAHKRSAPGLDIQYNGFCSGSKLFAHDARRDERNARHRSADIAESVHSFIRRVEVARLADDAEARFPDDALEFVKALFNAHPGYGFEFVERAAGMCKSPAADLCNGASAGSDKRSND